MTDQVNVVRLIGEAGWASFPGASLKLSDGFPEYGLDSLLARGPLLQIARLLPSASAQGVHVTKVAKRLQKFGEARPEKAVGRQLLLQGLAAAAEGMHEGGDPRFEGRIIQYVSRHLFTATLCFGLNRR